MTANSPIWINTIAPGKTFIIPQAGTSFEFFVQTGTIAVRARTNKTAGQFNVYPNGTGEQGIHFDVLELKNTTTKSVAFAIFVGSSTFVNRGLANNLILPVLFPTFSAMYDGGDPNAFVDVRDLSGTTFQDLNGTQWIAIARNAIIVDAQVQGTDASPQIPIYLYPFGTRPTEEDPAFGGIVLPGLSRQFNISGDYTLIPTTEPNAAEIPPGAMWFCVSEIYQAIAVQS